MKVFEYLQDSFMKGFISIGIIGFLLSILTPAAYKGKVASILESVGQYSFKIVAFLPLTVILFSTFTEKRISADVLNLLIIVWFMAVFFITAPILWFGNEKNN